MKPSEHDPGMDWRSDWICGPVPPDSDDCDQGDDGKWGEYDIGGEG